MVRIAEIDRAILAELRKNGRMSYVELAKLVGASERTVQFTHLTALNLPLESSSKPTDGRFSVPVFGRKGRYLCNGQALLVQSLIESLKPRSR